MKIRLNSTEKGRVYNGSEDGYYNFEIDPGIQVHLFKSLRNLQNSLHEIEYQNLLEELKVEKLKTFDSYISSMSGLPVKYIHQETKNTMIFISAGEKHKGVFQIYLEGLADIDN